MSAGEKYEKSTKTHTATTRAQGRREANTAPHEATNLLQSERRGRKRKKKKRSYQTFTVFLLTVYYLLLQMSNQRDRNWLSGISSVRSRITGRRKADIFES